jgi:2-polyprenyl-3-methyl-5-hydroxy-6-metoxy-1,4-benzoquinol methylase
MKNSSISGHEIYTNNVLKIYDLWVLGFSNHLLWNCPTKYIEDMFTQHTTKNHLDIGVGTGYYLKKCLDNSKRRLALLDFNQNSLEKASLRISSFQPEIYQTNILESLNLKCGKFDSISINYLLHCLKGDLKDKSIVFQNILPYLNNNGVVFGSTILGKDIEKNFFASKLMNFYNKKGIFSNTYDSLEDLEGVLQNYFCHVEIKVIGNVACFYAKR